MNVPSAPYPQFDIKFDVPGLATSITARYMVASAHGYIGPDDPQKSSFSNPDNTGLLQAPGPITVITSATPAPRTVPMDSPSIPAGDSIIIYIHGGGSRAEEAVGLANWLLIEGSSAGTSYTVISFDLPNSAFASTFDVSQAISGAYDPSAGKVLAFEEQYIINFIEALDMKLGNVKNRIVALMGGSLGGNMSLLLSTWNQRHPNDTHAYLNSFVAWSATSIAPSTSYGFPIGQTSVGAPNGPSGAYLGGVLGEVSSAEAVGTEAKYIQDMYFSPLSKGVPPSIMFIPAQPIMWYRGPDWEPCKSSFIAQSRFDRYEIYSSASRHWTSAVDLELVYLSFQDNCFYQKIAAATGARLLLAAGEKDNYDPVDIYNNTLFVANLMKHSAQGKAEFWLDTGHSFHDERPHLFAKEIVDFLNGIDSSTLPYVKIGAPMPAAPSDTGA